MAHERHWSVALTLAAAAVVAAGLGARTAVLFGDGNDHLQSAVRTEVKRGAGIVEDIRFVYQDEAPAAYRYLRAASLAQALRQVAARSTGTVRAQLLADAETEA